MNIAGALTCLMVLAVVSEVTGLSEQELDTDSDDQDQSEGMVLAVVSEVTGLSEQELDTDSDDQDQSEGESRMNIRVRRRKCKKLHGFCVRRKKSCPDGFSLETEPGRPYCSRYHRCCYPDIMSFKEHISTYNLKFANKAEKLKRREIFEDNVKKILHHNILYASGKTSYKKGLNQYSHLTHLEIISKHTGLNPPDSALGQICNELYVPINSGNEPDTIDWRTELNPIRDQGGCGSCWAFSTVCAIESQIKIKTGVLQQLSEQYLVDCDTGNDGCEGGLPCEAIHYVIDNGIALAAGYPYTGQDGTCDTSAEKTIYKITSEQSISTNNDADLLNACVHIGPISVGIYASENFVNYENGVFVDADCTDDVFPNHAVDVVGYGNENGQDYWLVRNSWGTTWGEEGYIKMTRTVNNFCQISSNAVFPLMDAT